MCKADNMLAILWLLNTRRRMTAREIADTLEIHIRTVYRYIDGLCASGVPIEAEAGHDGGYRLSVHFRDIPLFFDMEEQKALVHAAVFARQAGYPFGEALDRAITKIERYASLEGKMVCGRFLSSAARGKKLPGGPNPHVIGSEEEVRLRLQEQAVFTFVPYYLLPYGAAIQIAEPASLRERMAGVAEKLAVHYRSCPLA